MPTMRAHRAIAFSLIALALLSLVCSRSRAQAALLMEEPYGFFGFLNPTGHDAVYFERICVETPVKLRRCTPGELGAVIARYQGIADYDWVAMPLLPYLYAVESASEVPTRADHETVTSLHDQYHDAHLLSLGKDVPRRGDVQRGWSQFVGVAYERRIYAFRFATAEGQDDALIARMNAGANRSRFNLLYSNCADFNSGILNFYFPRTFRRSILPDAGITTPRAGYVQTAALRAQAPRDATGGVRDSAGSRLSPPKQSEQKHCRVADHNGLCQSPCLHQPLHRRGGVRRLSRMGPLSPHFRASADSDAGDHGSIDVSRRLRVESARFRHPGPTRRWEGLSELRGVVTRVPARLPPSERLFRLVASSPVGRSTTRSRHLGQITHASQKASVAASVPQFFSAALLARLSIALEVKPPE